MLALLVVAGLGLLAYNKLHSRFTALQRSVIPGDTVSVRFPATGFAGTPLGSWPKDFPEPILMKVTSTYGDDQLNGTIRMVNGKEPTVAISRGLVLSILGRTPIVYTPVQLAVAKWNGKKVKVPANMIFWGAVDPEKDLTPDAKNETLIEGTISGTGQYHALAHDMDFVAIDLDVGKLNADMAAAMPTAGQNGKGWLVKKPESIQTATPSA